MNWIRKNFKTLIYLAFLVPILTVAIVSISHVTKWYGISNPLSWAAYLSVGVEIAALSALAAISAKMGRKVYFPFILVTLIQFIGNIFFAYQYIDVNSMSFKNWVDMTDPLVSFLGVESGNMIGHKRFLALFAGGMLPLISLSFLHMLVKYEEEGKNNTKYEGESIDIDKVSIEAGKIEAVSQEKKWTPTEEELKILEKVLLKSSVAPKTPSEMMITNNEDIIKSIPPDDEISDWDSTIMDGLDSEEEYDSEGNLVKGVKFYDPITQEPKINRLVYTK
jgi:hypothetical protein